MALQSLITKMAFPAELTAIYICIVGQFLLDIYGITIEM